MKQENARASTEDQSLDVQYQRLFAAAREKLFEEPIFRVTGYRSKPRIGRLC